MKGSIKNTFLGGGGYVYFLEKHIVDNICVMGALMKGLIARLQDLQAVQAVCHLSAAWPPPQAPIHHILMQGSCSFFIPPPHCDEKQQKCREVFFFPLTVHWGHSRPPLKNLPSFHMVFFLLLLWESHAATWLSEWARQLPFLCPNKKRGNFNVHFQMKSNQCNLLTCTFTLPCHGYKNPVKLHLASVYNMDSLLIQTKPLKFEI